MIIKELSKVFRVNLGKLNNLTIQKVGSHQEFQGNFWGYGKFRYFCRAVSVAHFVGEIHADLLENMRSEKRELS